jgi:D-alanine-D-alanine ligase
MKIAILFGGKSGEHEVSLVSATHVARKLNPTHRVTLIGISKEGIWHLQPDSMLSGVREDDETLTVRSEGPLVMIAPGKGLRVYGNHGASDLPLDVIMPILHGSFGEDGTIQGLLECAGLAYTGADVAGSAIGMAKDLAKKLWQAAGLPVVPFLTLEHKQWDCGNPVDFAAQAEEKFGWPVFVKPARAGSSVGAAKASNAAAFEDAVRAALRFDTRVMVEPFIQAREIECAVLGNDDPQAFVPGEVVPGGNHEFYDYEAKYTDPEGAALFIPAKIDPAQLETVRTLALEAYKVAKLSGMARIDFFLSKQDGKILLNEANTIPGFTPISLYPRMCEAGGLPYSQLLDTLLDLAMARHQAKSILCYSKN